MHWAQSPADEFPQIRRLIHRRLDQLASVSMDDLQPGADRYVVGQPATGSSLLAAAKQNAPPIWLEDSAGTIDWPTGKASPTLAHPSRNLVSAAVLRRREDH